MSWNEKDFLRWSAQSYARLGPDVQLFDYTVNQVKTILTVPVDHVYLLRSYFATILITAVVAGEAYSRLMRGGLELWYFHRWYSPAVTGTLNHSMSFPYPMPLIAGDIIGTYSSNATTSIRSSYFYTDVDLTVFPAYDPGF